MSFMVYWLICYQHSLNYLPNNFVQRERDIRCSLQFLNFTMARFRLASLICALITLSPHDDNVSPGAAVRVEKSQYVNFSSSLQASLANDGKTGDSSALVDSVRNESNVPSNGAPLSLLSEHAEVRGHSYITSHGYLEDHSDDGNESDDYETRTSSETEQEVPKNEEVTSLLLWLRLQATET